MKLAFKNLYIALISFFNENVDYYKNYEQTKFIY